MTTEDVLASPEDVDEDVDVAMDVAMTVAVRDLAMGGMVLADLTLGGLAVGGVEEAI